LGREAGEAVASSESLRHDAKENRAARIEAEQRARRLHERVLELEHKLEMAEANLRTVLAAARGRGATAAPSDNEMEALLKILKTPGGGRPAGGRRRGHGAQRRGLRRPEHRSGRRAGAREPGRDEPQESQTNLDAEAAASNAE
jgi:hypothetical protein